MLGKSVTLGLTFQFTRSFLSSVTLCVRQTYRVICALNWDKKKS